MEEKIKKTEKKEVKETKMEEKVETEVEEIKKTEKKETPKKEMAIANGYSMKISTKHSMCICKIIRGKSPEAAINRLQAVIDEKRPVPMAGLEVGHRKGKGLAGGRFPKNACKAIMELIKQLEANAVVVGIENPVITIAKANRASAPYRGAGRKAKRTHMYLEVKDKTKLVRKTK